MTVTALHDDEVEVDEATVRRLVADQFPEWADLPLRAADHGTDNVMLRLGDDLVVRLPRTAGQWHWIHGAGPTRRARLTEDMRRKGRRRPKAGVVGIVVRAPRSRWPRGS